MGKSDTYNGHNGIAPPYERELPTPPPIPREKVKPEKATLAEKAQESIDDAMNFIGDDSYEKYWHFFYIGKAWAYLDVALGGDGDGLR